MVSGCASARCRPYSAVRRPVRNPLTFDSSVRANSRQGPILATEAVNDGRIGSCHAITGGSLGRSDMKALTTAPQRLVPEVSVECNNSELIRQCVLDESLVVLGFDASVSRAYDPMTPAVQK